MLININGCKLSSFADNFEIAWVLFVIGLNLLESYNYILANQKI